MPAKPVVYEVLESGDDASMRGLVDTAKADALDDWDVADLARGLAASGACLMRDEQAADLASTGGPSSLSTLLCPLHLRARGLRVPKLGVRGRPAGGIDVLETIPGFQAALDPMVAAAELARSGYVHLLADERWAPLDARLFAYRQRADAQAVPALVIASILAKKIAAGATGAGLEVRVAPHGNFGADVEAARRNARRYNAVATLLGLEPICALTDATRPYQPYIGRGEALVALAEVLAGRARGWLADHHMVCLRISDALAATMRIDTTDSPEPAALRDAHDGLLRAHGTDWASFESRVEMIRATPRITFYADRTGTVVYDLAELRSLLVARQREDETTSRNPVADPAGVILEARVDTEVSAGEALISVRVPKGERRLAEELASCAGVGPRRALTPSSGAAPTLEII